MEPEKDLFVELTEEDVIAVAKEYAQLLVEKHVLNIQERVKGEGHGSLIMSLGAATNPLQPRFNWVGTKTDLVRWYFEVKGEHIFEEKWALLLSMTFTVNDELLHPDELRKIAYSSGLYDEERNRRASVAKM